MKRTLLMAALFVVLGAGAWYALNYKMNKTGTALSWDMDFAVTNTADIGKIFLADRKGQTALLERKDDYWMYNGKFKARPTAVQTLLETISQVKVDYIPTDAARVNMVKSLATEGTKVIIYDRGGKQIKSYYVGGVTNDERGTYMIMDGSEKPFVVHIPSFIGQIAIRYFIGDDKWRDRTVFSEKPEEIESVSVEYPKQKSESFTLTKVKEAEYEVKPLFSTTKIINQPHRKGLPEAYILQFENLGSEGLENSNPARDSVSNLVPFAIVKLKKSDGSEKTVRFWPLSVDMDPVSKKTFVTRYYTDVNNGECFYLTQDRVFGPIFRGYSFFYGQ